MNSQQVKIALEVSIPLFTGLDYNENFARDQTSTCRLNPFIYRAGLQLVCDYNGAGNTAVSIPLFTGLDYNRSKYRAKR